MKTVVETFLIEETVDLIYDNEKLENWNSLVNELGLDGQRKIVAPEKSPIPFMHLKESLKNILECLCPRKVSVEKYNITPIPVEILSLVSLSKKEEYFDEIQIWYDDKDPDPACIGIVYTNWYVSYQDKNKEQVSNLSSRKAKELANSTGGEVGCYNWYMEHYLIGKWADVKKSFDELREMATKRFISEEGHDLNKTIKEATRKLADLESLAFEKFN